MRKGQSSQSRVRYKRAVGFYNSPYRRQQGGTIVGIDPFMMQYLNRRAVRYPWLRKGKKSYKRKRKR